MAGARSVKERAAELRRAELGAAEAAGFVRTPLSEGQEGQVVDLWAMLVRYGVGDPFVSGGVDALGFGRLASSAKLGDLSEEERLVVEAGLAVARGHRVPWLPPGNWPGMDDEGRPMKPVFIDSEPGEDWQIAEMAAFLEKALKEKAISEVPRASLRYCLPIFVIDQGTKKRVIWDGREVNYWTRSGSVKYEGVQWAELLNARYMSKLDLHSGYYQVPVAEQDKPWLGFSWTQQGKDTRYFQWNVMPFGLSSAPKAFTELLKVLAWRWRVRGVARVIVYLDDIWFAADSFEEWRKTARMILSDLHTAGLRVSAKKAFLGPYSCIEFLGILVDSILKRMSIPDRKIEKLRQLAGELIEIGPNASLGHREVKSLERFLGTLAFCGTCFKGCGIFRRLLDDVLKEWNTGAEVCLGTALHELTFWRDNAPLLNHKPLNVRRTATLMLVADTSDFASGCVSLREGRTHSWAVFQLLENEKTWSSTARELVGLAKAVRWLASSEGLSGVTVVATLDNVSAAAAADRLGMGSAGMLEAMKALWAALSEFDLDLRTEWCPRWKAPIPLADWLSNQPSTPPAVPPLSDLPQGPLPTTSGMGGDLPGRTPEAGSRMMLSPRAMEDACRSLLGHIPEGMVDAFSEPWSAQPACTGGFCSRSLVSNSLGNAFCLDWSGKTLWAFPPFSQTLRVLHKWTATVPPCTLVLLTKDCSWDPLPGAIRCIAGAGGRSCAVPRFKNQRFGLLIKEPDSSERGRLGPPPFNLIAWLLVKTV